MTNSHLLFLASPITKINFLFQVESIIPYCD